MEENMIPKAPVAPRRRKRQTKMQIIKEAYLPYIFLMAAALLILIFIIGALIRGAAPEEEAPEETEEKAPVICILPEEGSCLWN